MSCKRHLFTCFCRTEEDLHSITISHKEPEGKVDKVCCFAGISFAMADYHQFPMSLLHMSIIMGQFSHLISDCLGNYLLNFGTLTLCDLEIIVVQRTQLYSMCMALKGRLDALNWGWISVRIWISAQVSVRVLIKVRI